MGQTTKWCQVSLQKATKNLHVFSETGEGLSYTLPTMDTHWRVQAPLSNTLDILSICFLITTQTLHKTHGNAENLTDSKFWQPTGSMYVCWFSS